MPCDEDLDDAREEIALLQLKLERIRMHVRNAETCGKGNPLAYVDAYKEIKKLVL